ncbi:MAG: SBBP repeat-containing protein [Candidatus Zixiibacteriota bacterium]
MIDRPEIPLTGFTENRGQWDDAVRYRVILQDATVWFTDRGPCFQLHDKGDENTDFSAEDYILLPRWLGAKDRLTIEPQGLSSHVSNFFLGNNPSRWRMGVSSFEAIVYRDIYPGIDVRYYLNGTKLEYDYMVSAGADPSQIRVKYEGATRLSISGTGSLVVEAKAGLVEELRPRFFVQGADNSKVTEIDGAFAVLSDEAFGFELNGGVNFHAGLIIDPVLTFSTYLGGSGSEYAWGIDIDGDGNIYVTGNTFSTNYPVVEPLQSVYAGGEKDIFVSKLNPADGLLYSTYLGGSGNDENPRLVVDSDHNILLIGRTFSSDFPTASALYSTRQGLSDAFVAKISSDGDSLVYSTYLGGMHDEWGTGIAVDSSDCAYLTGITESDDFPTVNAYCSYLVKNDDSWVTKITPDGSSLVYSTYIGGSGHDRTRDIQVDALGRAYITGETYSSDFPMVNAFDDNFAKNTEGIVDAFLVRFSSDGTSLEYSTFIGGSDDDWCNALDVTEDGKATVVGDTESDDFPTLNPIQAEHSPDTGYLGTDIFVTGFSADGRNLVYSTYLGGIDDDLSEDIAFGPFGSINIVGSTYSPDFPLANALDDMLGVTDRPDAFAVRLSSQAKELTYSTFLGGDSSDIATSVEADGSGTAFITGYTLSADFPLVDPLQSVRKGTRDIFIAAITGGCCSGVRGNVNGDVLDVVDVADVIYAVQWSFEHGGGPDCLEEADADGNGRIDIEDLVFLVEYLYGSGPQPASCGE